MDADAVVLNNVFALDRQFRAPLFQRPYVWNRDRQWEPLWEDIQKIAEALYAGNNGVKPHFLGAIVLDQQHTSITELETRYIIDGQQRLATLQVLFAAFRDVCEETAEDKDIPQAIERMMFNDDPMVEGDTARFRVWPTNVDRAAYLIALTAGSRAGVDQQIEQDSELEDKPKRLVEAYQYFHDAISHWVNEEQDGKREEKLRALLAALRYKLRLVVIGIDNEDDAQMIFETLNARGTPLLPSDLVKNFLFREADIQGAPVQHLYEAYWEPFEEEHKFWRREARYGRRKRTRIDIFLHHYLTLMGNREVSASRLFDEFQQFAEERSNKSASWHLQMIREYAEIFKGFLETDLVFYRTSNFPF